MVKSGIWYNRREGERVAGEHRVIEHTRGIPESHLFLPLFIRRLVMINHTDFITCVIDRWIFGLACHRQGRRFDLG